MGMRRDFGFKGFKLSPSRRQRLARQIADLRILHLDISSIERERQSPRRHGNAQIERLAEAIGRFGFLVPVLVDEDGRLLAGHARLEAAWRLGWASVPAIPVTHLKAADKALFSLWDNRLAEMAAWDRPLLRNRLEQLEAVQISSGGSMPRLLADRLERMSAGAPWEKDIERADQCPAIRPAAFAVTRQRDAWLLGEHRLLCNEAPDSGDYKWVLDHKKADMVFTDPLVDRPFDGEGARAEKESGGRVGWSAGLEAKAVSDRLEQSFAMLQRVCQEGAIILVCMAWQHQFDLFAATERTLWRPEQTIVWVKPQEAEGTFYREGHEFIYAFKNSLSPHHNNFEIPAQGRDRSNVWAYPGAVRSFAAPDRAPMTFPTAKSVALVADALVDCSSPGSLVLDPFGGCGTNLIAAELCKQKAAVIEADPVRCDVIVERWQTLTGKKATLAGDGVTFDARKLDRLEDWKAKTNA